jgi:hypothetical protein
VLAEAKPECNYERRFARSFHLSLSRIGHFTATRNTRNPSHLGRGIDQRCTLPLCPGKTCRYPSLWTAIGIFPSHSACTESTQRLRDVLDKTSPRSVSGPSAAAPFHRLSWFHLPRTPSHVDARVYESSAGRLPVLRVMQAVPGSSCHSKLK